MASSESQGLQFALIGTVILCLLLIVGTFVFYQKWTAETEITANLRKEAGTNSAALRDAQAENTRMKEMVGFAPTAKLTEAEEAYKVDMDTNAATFPVEKRRYRDAMAALAESLKNTSAQLAEQQAMTQDLKDRHLAREEVKQQQIAEHEKAFKDMADRLQGAVAEFKTDRERITGDRDQINERFRKIERELQDISAQFDTERKRMTDDRQLALARANEAAKKLKDVTQETFDVADGQLVKVNLKDDLVWINLGTADDLKPQITFSVYGPSENDVARTEKKGAIEVVRVLKEHLAEARIIDDKMTNPMTLGDKIFTPAWHPGRKERFALVGKLGGEATEGVDRQTLAEIINMSGGVIDAEVNEAGQPVGKMTFNTRYLITGDEPKDEAGIKQYAEFISEAESLGVERITVAKFLDHMGYKNAHRLLRYDDAGDPAAFKPRRPDGGYPVSTGIVSEIHRKRRLQYARPRVDPKPSATTVKPETTTTPAP